MIKCTSNIEGKAKIQRSKKGNSEPDKKPNIACSLKNLLHNFVVLMWELHEDVLSLKKNLTCFKISNSLLSSINFLMLLKGVVVVAYRSLADMLPHLKDFGFYAAE